MAESDLARCLWELVWSGRTSTDTLAPLRAFLAGGGIEGGASGGRRRASRAPARTRTARLARGAIAARAGSAAAMGRWVARAPSQKNNTERAAATAQALLDRYGIVTRGAVANEGMPGGFAGAYRVLSALEDAGTTRRGYFIEGLGAAQFASANAVDQLRALAKDLNDASADALILLSACDPANPYGAALPWPKSAEDQNVGHRPGRKAGSLVVIRNGELALYVERGGKTVLGFTNEPAHLTAAFLELARCERTRSLAPVLVQRYNGISVSESPAREAMEAAGFSLTPRGIRLRPS